MKKKHPCAALILCYVLWGFQPLYWAFLDGGETFSASQLLSFSFFLAAILIFTFGEIRRSRRSAEENFEKAQKES